MKDTIPINYEIKFDKDKIFKYREYFVPYSAKEIQNAPFLSSLETDYTSLFAVENKSKKLDFLLYDSIPDERILPDTANILMDCIYCVKVAFSDWSPLLKNLFCNDSLNSYSFSSMVKMQKDLENSFGITYVNTDDASMLWSLNKTFATNYIGLYTELIKFEISEIKYVISALAHLYNSDDNINKDLANSFLFQVKERYSLDFNNFLITNKSAIKTGILSLLNLHNFKYEKNYSIKIDLDRFDRFISLLKKYKGFWGKKNFVNGSNCFCLTSEGGKWFFSVSGFNTKNQYNKLGYHIKHDLEAYFKPNLFEFCETGEDMLSYGTRKNGKFVKFPKPIKYKDIKEKTDDASIPRQYSCCERKIFQHTTSNTSLYIFCKYAPCDNCILAIREQKKLHKELLFFAFAKDPRKFDAIIKKEQKLLLKNWKSHICTFF